MSLSAQSRLLGEFDEGHVSIDTSGRVIRPFLAPATELVDEARVHLTQDGIEINVVDPANVAMTSLRAYPAAFDSYDVQESLTVGLDLNRLTDVLSKARLGSGTDDPIHLDVDGDRAVVEIEREYDTSTVRFADEMLTIDPNAVRKDPDLPELELPNAATVDMTAFVDAVTHLDQSLDSIAVRPGSDGLKLTAQTNDDLEERSAVLFEDAIQGDFEEAMSVLSADYLVDIADGIGTAKPDELTIRWGDEFPAYFDFERTDGDDVLYEGTAAIAPRIGGDDD